MVGRAEPALRVHHRWMASMANINDVLEGQVALEIECVDRLYLNAYNRTAIAVSAIIITT
jgi:hypothetical protein